MPNFIVKWKLEGEYKVSSEDLDFDEDETPTCEQVRDIIGEDPFIDCNPQDDGKLTLDIVQE
jgi:hypothetical protein